MKIIHTADWHLGKNLEGHSRIKEQEAFLGDFVHICEEEQADLILIAGDVFDSYNPSALAEQLFYDTLKQLSRGGRCMTVVIAGNHDNPERLTAPGPLAKEHGIVMAGTPGTVILPGSYGEHEITESGPGYIQVSIGEEKADLLLVPFPSEKRMNEVFLEETTEETEKAQSYANRIRLLFSRLSSHFRPDAVHLIVSHLFVMNSTADGSERSIQLGGSYIVGSEVFPENADYIALGHIHKPQKVPGQPNARYSGAPIHYNQREISFGNQVLAITAHAGQPCLIREIPLPVYKPVEVWKCASVEEAVSRCEKESGRDCWVYLEIQTEDYIHEEDIRSMKRHKADILSIRPVFSGADTSSHHAREPEELPFEVLVKDFYRQKFQTDMEPEAWELLLDILGEESDLIP